jgi:hypothetical protein
LYPVVRRTELQRLASLQVMDQIEGRNGEQLPWERDTLSAEDRGSLGRFRESLMMLLSRNSALRPSMEEFYNSCEHILVGSTSFQR